MKLLKKSPAPQLKHPMLAGSLWLTLWLTLTVVAGLAARRLAGLDSVAAAVSLRGGRF